MEIENTIDELFKKLIEWAKLPSALSNRVKVQEILRLASLGYYVCGI